MKSTGLRILPGVVALVLISGEVVSGCKGDDPVRTSPNQGATPTMVTVGVDTYVSDSGYVKYHAVTDVWEMYDNTDTPYWRFPNPLVIDILDREMNSAAHIECDSAIYLTTKQLFRFDGDVTAVNVERDTFLTPQLFWDQRTSEFYTDSFIHIVKSERILEGFGFRSNDRMTVYSINHPTAILPASTFRREEQSETTMSKDSLTSDSVPRSIRRDPRRSERSNGYELQQNNLNFRP